MISFLSPIEAITTSSYLIEFVDDNLMCCLSILQLQEGRQKLLLDEQCISRSCEARVKQLQLVYEGKFEGQRSVFLNQGAANIIVCCVEEKVFVVCALVLIHINTEQNAKKR